MRVEEVKERVIEYLKENGCANVSELMRYAKCGKATIYKAIKELESKGVIKTKMVKNRKMVYLIENIPNYLKYLTVLTLIVSFLTLFSLSPKPSDVITVNLSDLNQCEKFNHYYIIELPPLIFISTLSVLIGYWLAVLTLKHDDIFETINYIKSKFNIQKLKRLF